MKSLTKVRQELSKTYDDLKRGAIPVEVAREHCKAADKTIRAHALRLSAAKARGAQKVVQAVIKKEERAASVVRVIIKKG